MRYFPTVVLIVTLGIGASDSNAQAPTKDTALETLAENDLKNLDKFEGQTVRIAAVAKHLGSERVFTIGKNVGRETMVLVLNPSVDTANLGETLIVSGMVRRFDPTAFDRDYGTFKATDYPNIRFGELVIVASAIRNSEGAQLPAAAPPGPAK